MVREKVCELVESSWFTWFILAVIFFNAITIGVQASSSFDALDPILELFNALCLSIYLVETCFKLYAYRAKYFSDPWKVFDFTIVVLSLVGSALLPLPIQFVRTIRIFRAIRLLRMVSLFKGMRIIVEAIVRSFAGVVWSALLLVVVIYVFDVIGVYMFGQAYPEYFGSLAVGAATLFETALSGWPDFVSEMADQNPWAYAYFIPYVVTAAFVILNVVVGVIVDAIQESTQAERIESSDASDLQLATELAALKEQIETVEFLMQKNYGLAMAEAQEPGGVMLEKPVNTGCEK